MKKVSEMKDLMEKKLSMKELEMVSGGSVVEEEDPDGIITLLLIMAAGVLAGVIIMGLTVLIWYVLSHDKIITATISAMDSKEGERYRKLSRSDKKKLWTEVYHRVR